MKIAGVEYFFNLERELESLGIRNLKIGANNIQASCPHKDHSDNHQSFGVNRHNGTFNCFTCGFSGSFLELIAYCKGITIIQALKYLARKYQSNIRTDEEEKPSFLEQKVKENSFLPEESIIPYKLSELNYFVEKRKINFEFQQKFEIGYDKEAKDLVIPWRDYKGRLVLLTRKFVLDKAYRYTSNSNKSHHLLGLHLLKDTKRVVLVEGIFDCIFAQQNGLPAVAVGSNLLSNEQVKVLYKVGAERVDILLDNDKWGRFGVKKALEKLKRFNTYVGIYNCDKKDINEMTAEEISRIEFKKPYMIKNIIKGGF